MQQVNLYQPVSKGVHGALSFGSAAMTLGVVITALLGLWAFARWQIQTLQESVAVVRNQQAAQRAMSGAQGPRLDALDDEELEDLVKRLGDSVQMKNRVLELLAGGQDGASPGFSRRLRAFATRHIDGIWLERLTLGASVRSVSVSGSALAPESVPRYLRSLAQDPALQGGEIDEFVIEQTKKDAAAGRLSFRAGKRGLVAAEGKNIVASAGEEG